MDETTNSERADETPHSRVEQISEYFTSRRGFLSDTAKVGGGALALSAGAGSAAAGGSDMDGSGDDASMDESAKRETHTFKVRLGNVSTKKTLQTSKGPMPAPHTPGAFAVHAKENPIFTPGEHVHDNGLTNIAEDGRPNPYKLGSSMAQMAGEGNIPRRDGTYGVFVVPVDGMLPAPAKPGDAFEFHITGQSDEQLSFATMFGQSNDLFYAPGGSGIQLVEDGTPIDGDITSELTLWDAGTEANQEPGVGPDQAPRQKAPGFGPEERKPVRPVSEADEYEYPETEEVLKATISHVA